MVTPCLLRWSKRARKLGQCYFSECLAPKISSRYTYVFFEPRVTSCINLRNVWAASLRTKGILTIQNSPNSLVATIFSVSVSSTGIWLQARTNSPRLETLLPNNNEVNSCLWILRYPTGSLTLLSVGCQLPMDLDTIWGEQDQRGWNVVRCPVTTRSPVLPRIFWKCLVAKQRGRLKFIGPVVIMWQVTFAVGKWTRLPHYARVVAKSLTMWLFGWRFGVVRCSSFDITIRVVQSQWRSTFHYFPEPSVD